MPYMPLEDKKIKRPEYADQCYRNKEKAWQNYYDVWKPVAKDTNRTRRPFVKPTVGQIK